MAKLHPFEEDVDLWNRYVGELRVGSGRAKAARSVGMHPRAATNWLKSRPLEAQEARDAEDEFTEQIEDKLAEAALAGEPWAINLWLKKRAPDRWADRERVSVGGNVNVVALSSPNELNRMLEALGVTEAPSLERAPALLGELEH